MSVQPVEQSSGSGILVPAALTAVGAGTGAWLLAPAKYKNFGDIVAEANKGDSFKKDILPKLNDLQGEEATALSNLNSALESTEGKLKEIGEKFKPGADGKAIEMPMDQAGKIVGLEGVPADKTAAESLKIKNAVLDDVAKIAVKGEEKEGSALVSDTLSKMIKEASKDANDKIPETLTKENVTSFLQKTGITDVTVEPVMNEGKEVAGQFTLKASKETIEKAGKDAVANKAGLEFFAKATEKDGKYFMTESGMKEYVKAGSEELNNAVTKLGKKLGKSWIKGAAIWGAVGLAVGIAANMLFGKKDAA